MTDETKAKMVERKSWEQFRNCGLFWLVNRTLHVFGWSIVMNLSDSGKITEVYPARVKFRGFDEDVETDGFIRLADYLEEEAEELSSEARL